MQLYIPNYRFQKCLIMIKPYNFIHNEVIGLPKDIELSVL